MFLPILTVTAALFIGLSDGLKWSLGFCPEPALQSSFDIDQYVGTWYEIARDKNIIFEYGDCTQARYTKMDDGKVQVFNTLMNPVTENVDSAKAVAKCNGAHCKVKFFLFYNGDYRIVSTDYTNYSIVYSCTNVLFFKVEAVWILGRTETLDASLLATIQSTIDTNVPKYGLDRLYYPEQGGSCNYHS
ncbi:hypothetical protein FGO68_gene6621 [Halteria grandinella]|uniref:Lipocalin/cytosolic fatty-acid binding domain-containing protein n=1 Tax=Halteria grandinella TaxID=5974 RepID=A0A8J8NJ91_HALGN|nr:hypothetical protein FGO68_gene6621 [Halteria grandinella]